MELFKKWPPEKWQIALGVVIAVILIGVVMFGIGRCSSPKPGPEIELHDPDGGVALAEYEARVAAAVAEENARIAELERKHEVEIAALADDDRREFEATRVRGRSALATWFKDRTRRLLVDGGSR